MTSRQTLSAGAGEDVEPTRTTPPAHKGYYSGQLVRSLVDDGFFVKVGSPGRIYGFHPHAMAGARATVHWADSSTISTVPTSTIEPMPKEGEC